MSESSTARTSADVPTERWHRLAGFFEEALARPPAEREDYLDSVCGGDDGVRRELRSLLRAYATAAGPVDRVLAALALHESSPAATPLSGDRVGPYELIREIGRGGMGVVYLARRADGLYDRQVALKVAHPALVDDTTRDRFLAERDILAGLSHPGIASLYDGGVTNDGHPYFTMEYVEGQPIDLHCDDRGLDLTSRLRMFLAVCDAVSAAHRALVVHRDLKPGNVLVTAEGHVKLLDFGIAKLLGPAVHRSAGVTAGGVRLMTPEYASPEQVTGERISTATDVHALGLLLYELLCGQRAHRFPSLGMRDAERVIVHEVPAPPSDVVRRTMNENPSRADAIARARDSTPSKLVRSLAGDLDRIVSLALRKEPERRYPSVSRFAEDVERYLQGRPVRARGDAPSYRARKFLRRHPAAASAAAAMIAAASWYAVVATRHAAELRRAFDQSRLEAERGEAVSDFLVSLFEASHPDLAPGHEPTGRELLKQGLRRVDQLSEQPALQGQLLHALGRVYVSLGEYDEARALAERAVEANRAGLGEDHEDVSESYRLVGTAARLGGALEDSERALQRALELDVSWRGPRSAETATDLHELGYTLVQLERYEEGEALLRDSLQVRRELFGEAHEDVAMSLSGLAYALAQRGNPKDAASLYREALAIRRARLGDAHPEVSRAHQNLAATLTTLAEYDEAEEHLNRALEGYRSVYGAEHPSIGITLNNLGRLRFNQGDAAGAERLFRAAVEMHRKLLGNSHPSTLTATGNLASALMRQKRASESEPLFREVAAIYREKDGEVPPQVLGNLAEVLRQQRKLEEAERLFREALAASRRAAERTLSEASIMTGLGRTLADQKRYEEASALLARAVELRRERLGDDHPDVVRTRGYLEELPAPWNLREQRAAAKAPLETR